MRALLTIIASCVFVTAAWAATRWEPPSTSRYLEGSGGSSVGIGQGAVEEDTPRAATGAVTGVGTTGSMTTGALTGGSTSTGVR